AGVGDNPDPSRYLAAIVRDGDVPVPQANVTGFLVGRDNGFGPWPMDATSDEGGVALLEDLEASTWIPSGTYDVLVAAAAATPNAFLVARYEDVAVPGVVDVDLADPRLVEVDITLDPDAAPDALVVFGRQVSGWTLFTDAVFVGTGVTTVLLEPERHQTYTWYGWRGDDPVLEIDEVDLTTARSHRLTLDEAQLVLVAVEPTLPQSVADATTRVCLSDARERHRHLFGFCPDMQPVRASPFVANLQADVRFDDDDDGDVERVLRFDLGQRDIAPAGGELVIALGGVVTAEIDTLEATYAPGARVWVTGSVRDASGNPLDVVHTVTRSPFRIMTVRPMLVVTDALGEVVHEAEVFRTLSATWGPEFTLADDAAPGAYTATFTWDTGAYQGALEATTTFEVVAE
ncbi:MAG: hypothetical protein EA416_00775, partial [Trueperaceae bacterium]